MSDYDDIDYAGPSTLNRMRAEMAELRAENAALRHLLVLARNTLLECGLRDEIDAVIDAARKERP